MADIDMMRVIVEVLDEEVGSDAPLTTVDVVERHGDLVVAVHTDRPGRFIGRRGAVSEAVRCALVERLGRDDVRFEIRQGPPAPPLDRPGGGVREPRRPAPGAGDPGAELDEPTRVGRERQGFLDWYAREQRARVLGLPLDMRDG